MAATFRRFGFARPCILPANAACDDERDLDTMRVFARDTAEHDLGRACRTTRPVTDTSAKPSARLSMERAHDLAVEELSGSRAEGTPAAAIPLATGIGAAHPLHIARRDLLGVAQRHALPSVPATKAGAECPRARPTVARACSIPCVRRLPRAALRSRRFSLSGRPPHHRAPRWRSSSLPARSGPDVHPGPMRRAPINSRHRGCSRRRSRCRHEPLARRGRRR